MNNEREKALEAALQGVLREFVPSRDKFSGSGQRSAFDAAQAAIQRQIHPPRACILADVTYPTLRDAEREVAKLEAEKPDQMHRVFTDVRGKYCVLSALPRVSPSKPLPLVGDQFGGTPQ